MPTRKEVSKLIDEFILQREKNIKSKIASQQEKLYNKVVLDFLYKMRDQDSGSNISLMAEFERNLKKFGLETHPEILRDYIQSSRSLGDMNMMYFSTMIDDHDKLEEIRDKTTALNNKKLGLNSDGTIKKGGFADRMITDKSVQRLIIKEMKKSLAGGFDFQSTREALKKIIVGSPEENGLIQQHYTTFAKDLLNSISNNNDKIYADELQLNNAFYAGGLISTSRSLCIENNGKIFTRKQIEALRYTPFIQKMYGANINEYDPYVLPGGHGCLHRWNWITDDLAEGLIGEQNKKASDRNKKFKEKHDL